MRQKIQPDQIVRDLVRAAFPSYRGRKFYLNVVDDDGPAASGDKED